MAIRSSLKAPPSFSSAPLPPSPPTCVSYAPGTPPCPCTLDTSSSWAGEASKKQIAYFETLSQLTLSKPPPLSPIETILIETFLVIADPSPPSLQLRRIIF